MRALPHGFLLGCATAGHQVEGGCVDDWSAFERQPGRIRDGLTSGAACDHWNRWREDLDQLAAHGHSAHRFSVEWSRIEPLPGRFDHDALLHYRDVARHCRALGMEPVVTLHHFALPLWLADRGGVLAAGAPRYFARYAALVARVLGSEVRWWVTINEPGVLATLGYLYGEWPPGRRSLPAFLRALRGTLRMHAAAAVAVRSVVALRGRRPMISVAHHVRGLLPADPRSPLDRAAAAIPDHVFNRWFLLACRSGRMLPPLGSGRAVPGLRGSLDYVGLNYYCDDAVSFDLRSPQTLFSRQRPVPGRPLSSFGWAIDAAGLTRALTEVAGLTRLPVMVTENGVADEADELRPRFLVDHLHAVLDAVDRGVDVRGYLHWTSMDNVEWAEGRTKRFGLLAVDPDTLERRPKPSAEVFARICRDGGVAAALDRDVGRPPA